MILDESARPKPEYFGLSGGRSPSLSKKHCIQTLEFQNPNRILKAVYTLVRSALHIGLSDICVSVDFVD